jgi:hypothetical protein
VVDKAHKAQPAIKVLGCAAGSRDVVVIGRNTGTPAGKQHVLTESYKLGIFNSHTIT